MHNQLNIISAILGDFKFVLKPKF